jgi:hypothetical protein
MILFLLDLATRSLQSYRKPPPAGHKPFCFISSGPEWV